MSDLSMAGKGKPTTGTALAPVSVAERIDAVDILRGFALYGVLTFNLLSYRPVGELINPWGLDMLDSLAWWYNWLFVQGKFMTMFSFLFGLGIAIQWERARLKGKNGTLFLLRRLGILLLIGILHRTLLWGGDILVDYALLGIVLLLFIHLHPKYLLAFAFVFLAIDVYQRGFPAYVPRLCEGSGSFWFMDYSTTPYRELVSTRFSELFISTCSGFQYAGPMILFAFFMGLYVGKRNILRNLAQHRTLFLHVFIWGLLVGGILSWVFYMVKHDPTFGGYTRSEIFMENPLDTISGVRIQLLSLAYMAGILLLLQFKQWYKWLAPLGALGRMALTNYLMQSVISTFLFYGYGFDLFGKISILAGIGIALLIYGAQIFFSIWWLRYFRFGPAEWLWRTLTYGHLQPMRRSPAS